MPKQNPQREATLLEYWKKGTGAREAASKTGIPEGSVFGYYRKFNKNPQRYHREAERLKPPSRVKNQDLLKQLTNWKEGLAVKERHDRLMKEGRYIQAKYALEAQMLFERYYNSKVESVTSFSELYKYSGSEAMLPYLAWELVLANAQDKSLDDAIAETAHKLRASASRFPKGHADAMINSILSL